MVEGFSTINTVFIDLDGTLIRGNTMRMFMRALPPLLLKKGKPMAAAVSLLWILLRAIRMVSHRRMKWNLTRIGRDCLQETDLTALADKMSRRADTEIMNFLKECREDGAAVCLATAAAAEYALPLAKTLGCDFVLATEFTPKFSDYIEKKRTEKLRSILTIMEKRHLSLSVFLTDHIDDLPTIETFADRTILVNPDRATLSGLTVRPKSIITTNSK